MSLFHLRLRVLLTALCACGLLLSCLPAAHAQTGAAALAQLNKAFGKKLLSIQPSLFTGYWAVQDTQGEVYFTNEKASLLLHSVQGFEKQREQWTRLSDPQLQQHWMALRRTWDPRWALPFHVRESAPQVLVWTAPDCPACDALERDLIKHRSLLNASIYIVPTRLADDGDLLRNTVMCNRQPSKVWAALKAGQSMAARPEPCEASERLDTLDAALRKPGESLPGTPSIVRPDGSLVSGWPSDASLDEVKARLGL